jgi:hypothetical protein
MSRSGVGRKGRKVLVRDGEEDPGPKPERVRDGGSGDGGGLLLLPVQLGERENPRQAAFLLLVLRYLIQNTNQDALALAVYAAAGTMKMTPEETSDYLKKMLPHSGTNWPKGFM